MEKVKNIYLFLTLFCLSGLSCKEVYAPPQIKNNPLLLVVDGTIIVGNDSTLITLSRTKSISDTAPSTREDGAAVSIIGISGLEFPFNNQGNGRYITAHLPLNDNQQYQLKIITKDGNEYRSALCRIHSSPPIDSVYWDQDSAGVNIYLNTHDPSDNTRYYRWQFVETWLYYAAFDSHLEYIDKNNIISRSLADQIFRCYHTLASPVIDVATTSQLSADIVNRYKITEVATGSEKIGEVYSILVRQYAITQEAFDFWKNLKKNTEQLGTLFDLQPFTELGNIECVNRPEAKSIGFISFTTLQEKRIFIFKDQVYSWNYKPYYAANQPCQIYSAYPEDISGFFLPPSGPYGNSMIGSALNPNSFLPIYLFSTNECVDCTVHGGSNRKPAYWP